jgi:hypothetical protein
MKGRSLQIFIVVCFFVVVVNIVFYLTYPINVGQSDNPTYLGMIITGSSNLMQASGYSAVLYVLTHPFLPAVAITHGLPSDIDAAWYKKLQTAQLLLHAALFSVSILLCVKLFGILRAAILALGWGCNVLFMSNVNATAPEWLQADLLILTILMYLYARTLTPTKKLAVYGAASVVFGLGYLVKYNLLLFSITLFGFVLLEKESWRFKALQSVISVVIFLATAFMYADFYHQKSTGTTQLTFDHGWVMTASLPDDYFSLRPEQLGVNSLRWVALSSTTPPEYFRAQAIENIGYGVSGDERPRYNENFQRIFRMSKSELIEFVKTHPLPKQYSIFSGAVPLYYYYGVQNIDELGAQVYLESLRLEWWMYLKRILSGVSGLFVMQPAIQPVPTFSHPLRYKFPSPDFAGDSFTVLRIAPPSDTNPYFLPYYNPSETVWFYGVKAIENVEAFSSASALYLALNVISLAGIFKLKSPFERGIALCILAGLLAFISASCMLMGMRPKELIAITPIYFLLISLGLPSAWQWLSQRISFGRLP